MLQYSESVYDSSITYKYSYSRLYFAPLTFSHALSYVTRPSFVLTSCVANYFFFSAPAFVAGVVFASFLGPSFCMTAAFGSGSFPVDDDLSASA